LNETLRRALLRARLGEEDVAARLEVDPKTVRRWMEGRVPYLRHRWALAGMLGLDETDLWPEVGTAPSRPEEVCVIYPHRDAVPGDVWRALFNSAEREIDILADSGLFLAELPGVLAVINDQARAGVRVRICLRDPDAQDVQAGSARPRSADTKAPLIRDAVARYRTLGETSEVEIRVHRAVLNNSIYRADEQLLVGQHAYGVPAGRAPVLYLCQSGSGDMVTTYLESFERVWARARPMEGVGDR
jgi:transcriptional regulator with XRE-family HTH domain